MNWTDILIIGPVLLLGYVGCRNGVVQWGGTVGGVIVGVAVTRQFYGTVGLPLSPVTGGKGMGQVLGFALVFLLPVGAAWVVGRTAKRLLRLAPFGWADS